MEEEQQNQDRTWSPAKFRQRVVGASVVVALAVLVLPIWLDGSGIDALDIQHAPAAPQVSGADTIEVPKPDADAAAVLESEPSELQVTETVAGIDNGNEGQTDPDAQQTTQSSAPDSDADAPSGADQSEPAAEQTPQLAQAKVAEPAPKEPAPVNDEQPSTEPSAEPAPSASQTEAEQPQPSAAESDESADQPASPPADGHQYIVQLGSFSDELNAKGLVENIGKGGFEAYVEPLFSEQGTVWRVRIGPYASRDQAGQAAENLRERIGRDGLIMRYD